MRSPCWPWCKCRAERRAIERQISAILYAEAASAGWLPEFERVRLEELRGKIS